MRSIIDITVSPAHVAWFHLYALWQMQLLYALALISTSYRIIKTWPHESEKANMCLNLNLILMDNVLPNMESR